MEIDKFAKYTTSPEEYAKFLKRLRHIAAVFLGYSVEEEQCILINGSSPRYEKHTGFISFAGYINGSSSRYEKQTELTSFDGHLRRFAGSEVELDITCPFSFVENASDEELANWIETVKENGNGRPDDR